MKYMKRNVNIKEASQEAKNEMCDSDVVRKKQSCLEL